MRKKKQTPLKFYYRYTVRLPVYLFVIELFIFRMHRYSSLSLKVRVPKQRHITYRSPDAHKRVSDPILNVILNGIKVRKLNNRYDHRHDH